MLKDAHLIELALASDRRVVSLDDTVRGLFSRAAATIKLLSAVCWVNPVDPNEKASAWLDASAPLDSARMLGAV